MWLNANTHYFTVNFRNYQHNYPFFLGIILHTVATYSHYSTFAMCRQLSGVPWSSLSKENSQYCGSMVPELEFVGHSPSPTHKYITSSCGALQTGRVWGGMVRVLRSMSQNFQWCLAEKIIIIIIIIIMILSCEVQAILFLRVSHYSLLWRFKNTESFRWDAFKSAVKSAH